jgi:hypothetical protein
MAEWQWEPRTRRYRESASGRFLGSNRMAGLRDAFRASMAREARRVTAGLIAGDTALPVWVQEMRGVIKTAYIDQYVMGRGGRGAMTQSDWGACGQLLREQYAWLDQFAQATAGGALTAAQVQARAALYIASSTQAFERGKAAAWNLMLPAYPGDGSSECRSNDRCVWIITETPTAYEATWRLGVAEHCPTCVGRSETWNPLVIGKQVVG